MKKTSLLSISLLLSTSIFAQNFEHTDRWGAAIFDFTLFANGSYLIGGSNGHGEAKYALSKPDGTEIPFPFWYVHSPYFEIARMPNGSYFVGYEGFSCDVFNMEILVLDSTGVEVWHQSVVNNLEAPRIAVFANGDLLYTADTKLFKLDGGGNFLWDLELGETISDIAIGPGDFIYVALPNGIFKLDQNGIDLDIMASGAAVDELLVNENGMVAGRAHSMVSIFSPDLLPLAQKDFGPLQPIVEFDLDTSHLAVLLAHDTSAYTVAVETFDLALNPVGSFSVPDVVDYQKIALQGDQLLLAGRENYGMGEWASVVKDFSFDGQTATFSSDAALEVTINSTGLEYFDGYDELTFTGVEATLRNNAADTLHTCSVAVLGGHSLNPWCNSRMLVTQTFTGLDLPPGGQVLLALDDLVFQYVTGAPVPDELCYFAYLPDHHIDQDHLDNFSCVGFVVDTNEGHLWDAVEINIFPNPASNVLRLGFSFGLPAEVKLSLRNALCQVVQQDLLPQNELDKTLDISGLSAGIYFLEMKMGGLVRIEKVVIQ